MATGPCASTPQVTGEDCRPPSARKVVSTTECRVRAKATRPSRSTGVDVAVVRATTVRLGRSPAEGLAPGVGGGTVARTGSVAWGEDVAAVCDAVHAAERSPAVLGPVVERLAHLADGGDALELAVGTGRVALALSDRGVAVHGVEPSPPMARRLRSRPGAGRVPVTVGDMATVRLPRRFGLVYLVANTIMNVTAQEEQVRVFSAAAAHLEPGGRSVLEVVVPRPAAGRGGKGRVFTLEPDHVGIETVEDPVAQVAWSHQGRLVPPLDARGRPAGQALGALPVRLAPRAGPDGEARRAAAGAPVGRLAPRGVRAGQPRPRLRLHVSVHAAP